MKQFVSLIIPIVIFLSATFAQAQQLAFPGAEGYGRFALGGRGGKVLFVTNLNDKGPGSLRAAIEVQGPRIVVFKVSGTIKLESSLRIKHPRITIAGQTAPGDGICLRKYPLIISADDAVVRFIRVRLGDEADNKVDGIDVSDTQNVIVDHCSVSWTLDEAVNTYHGAKNVTIQWCLISESLHNSRLQQGHGFAASLGGVNTSYHHNLLANNAGRNPSIAGEKSNPTINLDFRNNVIFNWQYRTLDGRPRSINVVNNYYKAGPASDENLKIVKIQSLEDGSFGKWYVQGNVLEDRSRSRRRNNLIRVDSLNTPLESAMIDEPVDFAPVSTETAAEAFTNVLLYAGAIRPKRDSHDERIIREVRTGKTTFGNGIISSQTEVGGWPKLLSAQPQQDTDNDGMPDEWERRYSPKGDLSLQSHQDLDGDGYMNVEEYLNQTNPIKNE
ncbi:MAG: pectate lyase [Planctomycetes bacterium]|nr:pectate lyase [Planctomycetota bacterium]